MFPPDVRFLTAQWVLPVESEPIEGGFVAAASGKILEMGRIGDLPSGFSAPEPTPGSLLTPGLVNTHLHLEQSYPEMTPKPPGTDFSEWLLAVVRQNREQGQPEAKMARAQKGCEELLSTGTTCVNDVASGPEAFDALNQCGLRGFVSMECFHPDAETVRIDAIAAAYAALQTKGNNRLQVGLSPHSPYNVAPDAWQALLENCQPSIIHTHAAESQAETLYLQGKPSGIAELHQTVLGKRFYPKAPAASSVAYLARFGLLNERTILAHAVHTDETDRALLAEHGVTIAHCPRSNLLLHGQTLNFSDWENTGIPMGLGTDGRISTPDLDLRAEARCAMERHGWSVAQALQAITLDGAKALRLDESIGTLIPGKSADCVLWQAEHAIVSEPERWLLQPSTRVAQVWIEGQCRWKNWRPAHV